MNPSKSQHPTASPSSDSQPDYAVVVPAYNEQDMLPRTIAALQAAMGSVNDYHGQLIVVDNNSTDATAEVARQHGAEVVFEPINQISRARNAGARATCTPFLVFVDADTVITPDLLNGAVKLLDSGAVCGGGATVDSEDPCPKRARRTLDGWNWLARRLKWAAGCFVFCSRDAWEAVGGFSHEVYASEEIWFSRDVRKWGAARGQEFIIHPERVNTSMRKLEWYSEARLAWLTARFLFFPWLLRSKKHCELWYERPCEERGAEPSSHKSAADQTPSAGPPE
ncbi:MAG: glycosyltransferase [Lentisphaerae bacterium]|jgi:glycosyltransferase involved in cell wall biosynthesis|nr:glycosyltransferase [Lentisphaerota bacterium]MBT4821392.1 glycosyltransferase [Lentisphaerota bacterium]MBT5608069.1 glycosyltransferase [Lentisphaerota bacterium]MBT7057589.1 glycosyltransferase [Lentisphaerota bacterium]MBT7840216.1 glycosyltransferase [Lentisphaerota bacterium]